MKKKNKRIWISLIVILFLMGLACGCCETSSIPISMELMNLNISENPSTTVTLIPKTFWKCEIKIYEGIIVAMDVHEYEKSSIIFEDGLIIFKRNAENFDWEIGKLHIIKTKYNAIFDVKILKVKFDKI